MSIRHSSFSTRSVSSAQVQPAYEQKYRFPALQQALILDWVASQCLRDRRYVAGLVSSLYYDTSDFGLYQEKRQSSYLKTKLRLRWYGDLTVVPPDQPVDCYLEVKAKIGTQRQKQRLPLTLPALMLQHCRFNDETLSLLPQQACDLLPFSPTLLRPMLVVRYCRHRFFDGDSHSRLTVDTDIYSPQANSSYFPTQHRHRLQGGVLEIKGQSAHLPRSLRQLSPYLYKESFSKYARCCESLMQAFDYRQ